MPELHDHDDEELELVMPFIVVTSVGGPFDDDAYVAGFEMGKLDALLGDYLRAGVEVEEVVRTENVPQADLIGMRNEWAMEHRPSALTPDVWSHVRFTRIEGRCEGNEENGDRCTSKGDAWEHGQWLCPAHRDGVDDER